MDKSGTYWYIIQSIILFSTGIIVFYGYLIYRAIVRYNLRSLALQREMEELRFQQEQLLLQTEVEIRERTFQYISMELHDNVSQVLSLAQLHLNCITLPEQSVDSNRLIEARELLSKSLSDISIISKSMDSDLIEHHGLYAAIQFEVDQWRRHFQDKVSFEADDFKLKLDKDKSLFAFRIIQEALNNTVKYAEADHILVSARKTDDFLLITISDDGVGFDFEEVYENKEVGKKSGLKNMNLRAKFIGGDLIIRSKKGAGTAIELYIPINQ